MSEIDPASAGNAESAHPPVPLLFRDVVGWYALATLGVGRVTGMLDAVVAGPVTASTLASSCGVDRRNAEAWLAAMTAHGYVTHADGTYTMPPSEAAAFRGESAPFDFGAIIDCCHRLPGSMAALERAMRSGKGVAPSVYHDVLGDAVGRVNEPLYRLFLHSWLAQAGLEQDLERGTEVAEIGCGLGNALLHLAGRYPASRFAGFDLDSGAVERASRQAHERGLTNVRFEVADATRVSGSFDIALVLDALHHFPHPERFLDRIGALLTPGGTLLVAEATAAGKLDSDASSPFARIVFSANLLLCLQEGLHDGGAGLGAMAGEERITGLLKGSGFGEVKTYDTGAGYTIFAARRQA